MTTININYKDQTIKTLEANKPDSIEILTGGKYCEGDIEIVYINHCPKSSPVVSFNITDFLEKNIPSSEVLTNDLQNRIEAYRTDYSPGSVQNGTWINTSTLTNCYNDIYQVEANKFYVIKLGSTVSNRFRVMFTTEDVTQATSDIVGVNIFMSDSPTAGMLTTYRTLENGYIVIQKTNNSTTGIETFVYESNV